ncbi:hypothetical protein Goklo_006250 [Gossypium klotzschianum]|nr:hypothetical protein [Gossypium klotzschianum]
MNAIRALQCPNNLYEMYDCNFRQHVREYLDVFMDDFLEKCHFMVKERLALGNQISRKGLEVDKAKIEVIKIFSILTAVRGVRNFLGHAGFYRSFIKDFAHISKPLFIFAKRDVHICPGMHQSFREQKITIEVRSQECQVFVQVFEAHPFDPLMRNCKGLKEVATEREWTNFCSPSEEPIIIPVVQEFYPALKEKETIRRFYEMRPFVKVRGVNVLVTKRSIC